MNSKTNIYKDIVFKIYLELGKIVFDSQKTKNNKLLIQKHKKKPYIQRNDIKYNMLMDMGSNLYETILLDLNNTIQKGMDNFYEISFYTILKEINIENLKNMKDKLMISVGLFLEKTTSRILIFLS